MMAKLKRRHACIKLTRHAAACEPCLTARSNGQEVLLSCLCPRSLLGTEAPIMMPR